MPLDFKDKVVIVTGAGAGLGREYALNFAALGAKVVVNDLGGSLSGEGASSKNADLVVDEIRKAGGTAVANYDNVLDGDKIVQTAVDAFGTVHVVINNAGILRDVAFKNMELKDFKLVLDVHLKGAYKVTHAAWPYMRGQKYGRIVNTLSPAGLYGNFGQNNYSLAKSALIGFAETLAKEGAKYNIKANVIAPLARSRMTEGILPPDVLKKIGPEKISPLVQYLAHEQVKTSGSIFEVAGGFVGEVKWQRLGGQVFNYDEKTFTPEAILAQWDLIKDFGPKPFYQTEYGTGTADYLRLLDESRKLTAPNPQGSEKVDLTGQVVIITGAGAGLGRSHALWFARYGASVVVNDFKDPHSVVEEIKKLGGKAVADSHNVVTDGEAIVKTALDAFGRLDVLVNNAGILRDKLFLKMTDAEWDQIMDVHVLGTFNVTKAAWPVFVKQKYGRVVNTTSTSGIYGSFGQANYAAAKCGITGFSKTLAIEGKKNGIIVNTIAPHAETAMTLTIFNDKDLNKFPPGQVLPMVVLLGSNKVPTTGDLFEVGAGWVGNTRFVRSPGAVHKDSDKSKFDINWIAAHIDEATDFTNPNPILSNQEGVMGILEALGGDDDEDEEDEEEEDEEEAGPEFYDLSSRNAILYNLGIGASAKQLKYTFEGDEDFQALPLIGVIPPHAQCDDGVNFEKLLKNFNPMKLLHGETYMRVEQYPIPLDIEVTTKAHPVAVAQKGKHCVVVGGFELVNRSTGQPVFYNEMTTFVRDCQGETKAYAKRPAFATNPFDAPKRQPDYVAESKTSPDQAAIYRLSADYNPLHIDPEFAKGGGFDQPILHGLCTFGFSTRMLVEKYGNFKEVKVRFTSVVFPGETLRVEAWKDGDLVVFRTTVVERKVVVINNAALRLVGDKGKL